MTKDVLSEIEKILFDVKEACRGAAREMREIKDDEYCEHDIPKHQLTVLSLALGFTEGAVSTALDKIRRVR